MKTVTSTLRDDQLIGLIRRRDTDPDAAADAWCTLYKRHINYLFSKVRSAANFVGRGISPEFIVESAFYEVYLRAADKFEPQRYKDDDHARRHVRAWLGAIAHHHLLSAIKSRANEPLSVRDPGILALTIDPRHDGESVRPDCRGDIDVTSVARSVLSQDEKEIVWLKMQYYDGDTGQSRVPPEQLAELCKRQSITKEVLRKRYERALTKLKEALSASRASLPYKRRI